MSHTEWEKLTMVEKTWILSSEASMDANTSTRNVALERKRFLRPLGEKNDHRIVERKDKKKSFSKERE